jgi:hypothetical protein
MTGVFLMLEKIRAIFMPIRRDCRADFELRGKRQQASVDTVQRDEQLNRMLSYKREAQNAAF